MVIDTSTIVAIILQEPTRTALLTSIVHDNPGVIAAPNALECHMVLTKHFGADTPHILQDWFLRLEITVVPFTPEHAAEAARAFDRYGKGRHPASLNFGDCIAYALSKVSGQKLLYVGEDFSLTDVRPAYRA